MKIQAETQCNLADTGCGELIMALMKAITPVKSGQVIEIYAADPGAVVDIPAWCRMAGHELLEGPVGDEGKSYFIRKGGKPDGKISD